MRVWTGSVYSFLRKRGLGVRIDQQGVGEGVLGKGDSTQGAWRGYLRKRGLSEPRDPWGGWVLRDEAREGAGA